MNTKSTTTPPTNFNAGRAHHKTDLTSAEVYAAAREWPTASNTSYSRPVHPDAAFCVKTGPSDGHTDVLSIATNNMAAARRKIDEHFPHMVPTACGPQGLWTVDTEHQRRSVNQPSSVVLPPPSTPITGGSWATPTIHTPFDLEVLASVRVTMEHPTRALKVLTEIEESCQRQCSKLFTGRYLLNSGLCALEWNPATNKFTEHWWVSLTRGRQLRKELRQLVKNRLINGDMTSEGLLDAVIIVVRDTLKSAWVSTIRQLMPRDSRRNRFPILSYLHFAGYLSVTGLEETEYAEPSPA